MIYYRFSDWLEGRQLSDYEVGTLSSLALDLNAWLSMDWVKTLSVSNDPQIYRFVAAAYDTLAMNDVAIGATRSDFNRERCERIAASLAVSSSRFQALLGRVPRQVRES